jgi:hypothetical protein
MRWCGLLFGLSLMGCARSGVAPQASAPVVATLVDAPVDQGPDIRKATYSINVYTHPTTDRSLDTTGGILRVHAPIDRAIQALFDFKDVLQIGATTVKLVEQHGDVRDVYVRVETVVPDYFIWTLIRFEPENTKDGFVYRGQQIDGNLDDLRIFWRLVPVGDETLARFELLGVPGIPLPRKWIMRDTRRGVLQVLESFRGVLERNEQLQSKPDDFEDALE